uniref:Uncharacterized protein n=1 Tax=Pseudomonas phage Pyxpy01 TaxID=3138546 RepID=A0AAU6VYW2_9VIRU
MKIGELIIALQLIQAKRGDIVVYLQSDQEGNNYEPVRGASFAYLAKDTWGGGYMYDTVKEALENDNKRNELTDVVLVWP